MRRTFAFLFLSAFLLCSSANAQERAIFDSHGRLAAILYGGDELPLRTTLVVPSGDWTDVAGQWKTVGRDRGTRDGNRTTWNSIIEPLPGRRLRFEQAALQKPHGAEMNFRVTAESQLDVDGVFLQIDLPRASFANGGVDFDAGRGAAFPSLRHPGRYFYTTEASRFVAHNAAGDLKLIGALDHPYPLLLRDRWERTGRFYTVYVELLHGPMAEGATAEASLSLSVDGTPDTRPAQLTLDAVHPRYRFDGFGGNYCFGIESPVTQYTLKNLRVRWARTEMSLKDWAPEPPEVTAGAVAPGATERKNQDPPGSRLRHEFELMRQLNDKHIPYVISVWRLPEWMYAEQAGRRRGVAARRVPPEKWDALVDAVGSYLLHAKQRYGAEPDLFSFNEANLGVDVLLTPQEHRMAIKTIGAKLERLGLKTKMVLADATVLSDPDMFPFALPTANDADALRYVGAIAFHSWDGGTPEQYAAWGDLAGWLQLPLFVSELGVDPSAWNNAAYNSFQYGMQEVRMYQEVLLYARPQATMQWEFTGDYSIVDRGKDGQLKPTARFWLVKHFTDLTPGPSQALTTSSDNPKVLLTAFAGDVKGRTTYTLHIANLGAARSVSVRGIPEKVTVLRAVRTSEDESFKELPAVKPQSGVALFEMPARSLLTLTTLPKE